MLNSDWTGTGRQVSPTMYTSSRSSSYSGSAPGSPTPGGSATLDMSQSATASSFCDPNRGLTATAKVYRYVRRLLRFRQMDFEFALWQMLYLFVSPQKVFRNFQYRKQSKGQWARDDPAFLVLFSLWLCASSVGFAVALHLGVVGFIAFILHVVFIDCILLGLLVATVGWLVSNKYFLMAPQQTEKVEWAYAFDVHLNALFPVLTILHVFQLFVHGPLGMLPIPFVALLISNTLWLCAVIYYVYITFLGYSTLPFVRRTEVLLYALTVVFLVYIVTLLFGWDLTAMLYAFYQQRASPSRSHA